MDEPIQYRLATEVLVEAIDHDWGWADLSIGARFQGEGRARMDRSRDLVSGLSQLLGGEGYLTLSSFWFATPRAMQIWWGRRHEVFDYLRNALGGKFMSQVVRKEDGGAGAVASNRRASRNILDSAEPPLRPVRSTGNCSGAWGRTQIKCSPGRSWPRLKSNLAVQDTAVWRSQVYKRCDKAIT